MDTVIVPRDAWLNRNENALVVTSDAGRKVIPLNGVKHVLCMGNGSVSIRLLKDMGRRGIRFTVLDAGGRFLGAFEPEEETPSGRVRVGQARLFLDNVGRLRIAPGHRTSTSNLDERTSQTLPPQWHAWSRTGLGRDRKSANGYRNGHHDRGTHGG